MVRPPLHRNALTFKTSATIKFLCSYRGKILPRYPDGKLRYRGGETRVLAVDRSISFSELLLKLGELCGTSVSLRCQLPREDLDALVSITSDEDLANLIEEYDRAASPPSSLKIRAFLSPPKFVKKFSHPSLISYSLSSLTIPKIPTPVIHRCFRQNSPPDTSYLSNFASEIPLSAYNVHGKSSQIFSYNSNLWE